MITTCQSPQDCTNPPLPEFSEFCSSECAELYAEEVKRHALAWMHDVTEWFKAKIADTSRCASYTCENPPVPELGGYCSKECAREHRKTKARLKRIKEEQDEHKEEIA